MSEISPLRNEIDMLNPDVLQETDVNQEEEKNNSNEFKEP